MSKWGMSVVRYHYGPYVIERCEDPNGWRWRSMSSKVWSVPFKRADHCRDDIDEYEKELEDKNAREQAAYLRASVPESERYTPMRPSPREQVIDTKSFADAMESLMINDGSRDNAKFRAIMNIILQIGERINDDS